MRRGVVLCALAAMALAASIPRAAAGTEKPVEQGESQPRGAIEEKPSAKPKSEEEKPAEKPKRKRPRRPFEPTASYRPRTLQGWTLKVHPRLLDERKELGEQTFDLLGVKLYEVSRVIPPEPLERLRRIPIWVEDRDPGVQCMVYHPSAEWLKDHGYNPDKAGALEIGNARVFLSWTYVQPSMLVHELAHGYHHQVLGWDDPEIVAAYKRALESKSYDSVLYYDGSMKRAYALLDVREFFAESTESWFGTNDFYPFVRPELLKHDPETAELVKKIWKAK